MAGLGAIGLIRGWIVQRNTFGNFIQHGRQWLGRERLLGEYLSARRGRGGSGDDLCLGQNDRGETL